MTDVIEGEAVEEPGTDLEIRPQSVTLFNTDDPAEVIARATRTAEPLAAAVRAQGLAVSIQGREHVKVEGWSLLGSMLGVFAVCVWTRKLENPEGWEARVEARTRDGSIVGAAEAQCTREENQWSFTPKGRNGQALPPRDDYALRSMAQTRATSKALRQPLGFVMQLAGFNPTPAEEMPSTPGDAARVITSAQQKRLFAKANEAGVSEDRVKELMSEVCGVTSSKDVPRDLYDALIAAVEVDGVPFQ